jgi:uncharacterized protein (TIGR02466 family)
MTNAAPDDLKIFKLWPTPILRKRFPDHEALKPQLVDFTKRYREEHSQGRKANENTGLYESHYDIFRKYADQEPAIAALASFLTQSFAEITGAVNRDAWKNEGVDISKISVNITASWFINYLERGNVDPHLHGNCSWSCVYYLQMPPAAHDKDGATYFISPTNKSGSEDFGAYYTREASRYFTAVEGFALFFPAHIVHGSFPSTGNDPRVIFSANAVLEGPRKEAPEAL